MLRLALATLRARRGPAVAGFLALFCAALVVGACGALLETGVRGTIPAERYSGTPVVVAADQRISWTEVETDEEDGASRTTSKTKSKALGERAWLPASVGDRLARLPGAEVAEDLVLPAGVAGPDGALLPGVGGNATRGHGWSSARLTPYVLVSGAEPRADGDVVLDAELAGRAGLEVGDRAVVRSTSSPTTYRVAGIVRPQVEVAQQSAVFFTPAEARRLAGRDGAVAAYGVFGVSAQQVEAALAGTGAVVATGDDRGRVEFADAASARVELTSTGGALAGTSLVVAVLVVVGTSALAVQQRHRELALLRAIGATPRQVRRLISREALVLGLLAGVPGALLGVPVASLLRQEFVSLGAIPDALQLARSPLPVIGAVVATAGAACVAARVAARRTARIGPAEALAEAAVERRALGAARVVAGAVLTLLAAGSTVLLTALRTEPAAMPVTYLSVLLWMVALSLLGPHVTRGAVALLGAPLRVLPVGGFLAVLNSRAGSRRVASAVTPLALLIAMTSTVLFAPLALSGAARDEVAAGVAADHLVTSNGPGVPAPAARALRDLPGVVAVTEVLHTTVWTGRDERSARGLSAAGLARVVDPGVTSGSLEDFGSGSIAMSDLAVQGRGIGDTVVVTMGDGVPARFRLVAVYDRDLGFGDVLLAHEDVVGHVDDPLAGAVLVKGAVPADRLRAQVRDFPELVVTDGADYAEAQAGRRGTDAGASLVLMGLIVAFTAIAVVNTLAMAVVDRIREFALLRLIGGTRRQVLAVLHWELAVIVLIAAVVGTGVALLTLTGFSTGVVGSSTPSIAGGTYALVLAGAVALGLVATVLPARVALRRNPAEDVGGERW